MSQSFEIQGEIHSIGQTTEYGSNGFTKREFVIKLTGEGENSAYPNYVALELIKDNCALMDSYNLGDEILAHFNLSGRLWAGSGKGEKCFTSLQAWRVQPASKNANTPAPEYENQAMPNYDKEPVANYGNQPPNTSSYDDDVPF